MQRNQKGAAPAVVTPVETSARSEGARASVVASKASGRSRADAAAAAHTVFATSFDAVILTDEGGACTDVNASACALFGCSAADVKRAPLWTIAGAENESELRALWSAATPATVTERALSLTLGAKPVSARARVAGAPGGFAFLLHVDAASPGDERVTALRVELEDANRQREGMLSLVSHDVRGPLGVLVGALKELTHPAVGTLTPDQQVLARLMERSLHRLSRFAGTLVDFARIESGRLDLVLRAQDLRPIVQQAVEIERKADGEKQVVFDWSPPAHPIVAAVDSERIAQVLANLLGNARRFAKTRVTVRLVQLDDIVAILVEDDGNGVPATVLPLIFYPWRRSDPRSGKSSSGVGLGLVRGLVEAHAGTVVAENLPPDVARGGSAAVAATAGARFTVRLPRANASTHPD